jgi:hypothetical protein
MKNCNDSVNYNLLSRFTISNSNNYQKAVFHHRFYWDTRGQYKSHSCMGQTLEIVINHQSRPEYVYLPLVKI